MTVRALEGLFGGLTSIGPNGGSYPSRFSPIALPDARRPFKCRICCALREKDSRGAFRSSMRPGRLKKVFLSGNNLCACDRHDFREAMGAKQHRLPQRSRLCEAGGGSAERLQLCFANDNACSAATLTRTLRSHASFRNTKAVCALTAPGTALKCQVQILPVVWMRPCERLALPSLTSDAVDSSTQASFGIDASVRLTQPDNSLQTADGAFQKAPCSVCDHAQGDQIRFLSISSL